MKYWGKESKRIKNSYQFELASYDRLIDAFSFLNRKLSLSIYTKLNIQFNEMYSINFYTEKKVLLICNSIFYLLYRLNLSMLFCSFCIL